MSKTVVIPNKEQPYVKIRINDEVYVYPSGTTQEVPDEVAALLEMNKYTTPYDEEKQLPEYYTELQGRVDDLEDKVAGVVPTISIHLAYVNAIMEAVATKLATSEDPNICVILDTSSDNTLHSALDACKTANGNVLTAVKAGDTERTMLFKYDNHNANGGIYSCDGFYVNEEASLFASFKMIVQWNQIGVMATKYTYVQ